ncbi:MAG TPA: RNA polymerase sigma-70 factor [Bacteroidetes bacterium]|nr:RNA polymerase sigma-70 factor [Bacteroidota bacterium]
MSLNKNTVKRFIKGDLNAFNLIYYTYSKKLYHIGLGLLKDPDKANEMVQDVFVTLWEKREKINPELNFENYLLTMTYNSIRKLFRKKKIEQEVKHEVLKETSITHSNTENSVIYNDLLRLAQNLIEKMPPKRKLVYKLNRQQGVSIKEISEKIGISKRTVEGHLTKALGYLKEEMAKYSLFSLLLLACLLP